MRDTETIPNVKPRKNVMRAARRNCQIGTISSDSWLIRIGISIVSKKWFRRINFYLEDLACGLPAALFSIVASVIRTCF